MPGAAWLIQATQACALLAAAAMAMIAVASIYRAKFRPIQHLVFIGACGATALWLVGIAWFGALSFWTDALENIRNLGWLLFMATLAPSRPTGVRISPTGWIYLGLLMIATAGAGLDLGLISQGHVAMEPGANVQFISSLTLVKMLGQIGALMLVHNLMSSGDADDRASLTLYAIFLSGMWVYDLNLSLIGFLSGSPATLLMQLRPVAHVILALPLALMIVRPTQHGVRLSRPVTFSTVGLAAISMYLAAMALIAVLIRQWGGDYARLIQIAVLWASLTGAGVLIVSRRLRRMMRVLIVKNFFEHRYDYRNEWMRFTHTMSPRHHADQPVAERIAKALADLLESPSAMLFMRESDHYARVLSRNNWLDAHMPADGFDAAAVQGAETSGRIIELDQLRTAKADAAHPGDAWVPAWLRASDDAWVVVPLIHDGRLNALVVLQRPRDARLLDWEDFDLLRVVSAQAAAYLAEADGNAQIADLQRFDEFNRRFAFIMHDVKNLASQLSLLARNVERHADNPEFRRDMIGTIQESADRLNSLLVRLGRHERPRLQEVCPVELRSACIKVAEPFRLHHPIDISGAMALGGYADPSKLAQVLEQLIQNAIDASAPGVPVRLALRHGDGKAAIDVIDEGVGMSADFMRTSLFKPFVSTKEGGFGVGLFQARQLCEAMGGTLRVQSKEGSGTIFTILIPLAGDEGVATNQEGQAA